MVGLVRSMGVSSARKEKDPELGILAFEAARTMTRLISLYKSLTDAEVSRMRNDIVKSRGVEYLISKDETFLLSLAWAERLEDLDRAAATVARIGKKCNDFGLNRFDIIYRDLKLGIGDLGNFKYGSKAIEKKVKKMEKLVATTSSLHSALEALTEFEISERKLKQWQNQQTDNEKVLIFYQRLKNQRREVRKFRELSLWSKPFDKTVDMMARIVCAVYTRILQVSGCRRRRSSMETIVPHSGPILPTSKPTIVRFYSRRMDGGDKPVPINKVLHAAGPCTVGSSGLALRYANVILLAEEYLNSTAAISREARESLYEMLPESLKALVGAKLSRNMRRSAAEGGDAALAKGWRDAVREMMVWLAPMARDTVAWQVERAFEKMKFEAAPAALLLLHTLHFADREKAEVAIAEVLVGLSCILKFENRHIGD